MSTLSARPAPGDHDPYYAMYVRRVPAGDLGELLERQVGELEAACARHPGDAAEHRYAPGKWSVREVIQHVNDTERVFGYRLLRFARRDATPLEGFDQDLFVANGRTDRRGLDELVREFRHLRLANTSLARALDADALAWRGRMWDKTLTTLALVTLLHGHAGHHLAVLEERYRPVIG